MTPQLKHHRIAANGIHLHVAEAGDRPPVVLLHGYPETWYAWRHQQPKLGRNYRLIMPDLRGYGDSDKPDVGYDKRTMAEDIRQIASYFGYERIAVIGHDRGARVATCFAKDHRAMIDRLVVIDNILTRVIFNNTDAKLARLYWFFFFQQVPHLPEALIADREEVFLRHFFSSWCSNPSAIEESAVVEYVRAYSQPGVLRGAFNDYRAGPVDLRQDIDDADQRIECPVLAIWGADFELVGKAFDVLSVWQNMARDVRGVGIPNCGHLPQEERPEQVNQELRNFLKGGVAEQ